MRELLKVLGAEFRKWGFKGSGQHYRCREGEVLYAINIQKSSDGDTFYVNLGAQPESIPTEDYDTPSTKTLKEIVCVARTRVEGRWPREPSAATLGRLLDQSNAEWRALVQRLNRLAEHLDTATAEELIEEALHLRGSTPRVILHLARWLVARGELGKAKRVAEIGLSTVDDSARILRGSLRELRKELDGG